jgi:hypothetical protein
MVQLRVFLPTFPTPEQDCRVITERLLQNVSTYPTVSPFHPAGVCFPVMIAASSDPVKKLLDRLQTTEDRDHNPKHSSQQRQNGDPDKIVRQQHSHFRQSIFSSLPFHSVQWLNHE